MGEMRRHEGGNVDGGCVSRGARSKISWVAALLVCLGALLVPTAANAWVDIDSPGEFTNDNTPLIKGDAEINFFIGIHSYLGCSNLGIDSGLCVPYFFFHPTVGYTDVTADLYKQKAAEHWCEDICSGTIRDIDLGTPTPPIDDLLAYSEPYSWTTPKLSDGSWRLVVHHYGEDAPSPDVTRIFNVDTRAPSGTTITAQPPLFSNDTTPTFDWTASDPAPSSGLNYQCSLDGGAWAACPNDKTFNTPEGNHTLLVKAVDKAGNEDPTPAAYAWMVDTTPPTAVIGGITPKQRFLLHAPIPATSTCDDPLSGGVRSGLAPSGVASSTGPPECSATNIDNENLGPHEFRITTEDRAGNQTTTRLAYVIDPPDYGDFIGDDDPLAYYRLAEAVGSSDMLDSSGNNHHGIYQNGIALGRNGATACERRPHPPRVCELAGAAENKAGYFPARDGHGYVNGIAAPTNAYTMEAWVKPRDGADMMVVSHGGGGQLFIKDGNLAFRQVQDTIYSNGAVLPGVWTHVAATWDGHNTRLYVNGVQVAHSTTANKPPSGTSTFYVGYGEMAPWFHGDLDEVAYYDRALSQHAFIDRHKIGVAKDQPSLEAGNSALNTEGPFTDPGSPKNGGLYAPTKTPVADFTCTDPDDLPGNSDIASCTATVDGNPIANGAALPNSIGVHVFTVTAIDEGGNQYIHNHTYTVKNFADLFNTDAPIAYCRLGDPAGGPMLDSSGNGRHGIYKNDQDSGPIGISGDGDRARNFFGAGGYGYINDIAAPRFQSTLEAWVRPADGRNQSIVGHGDAGEIYIKDGQFKFRRMGETVTSSVPPVIGQWQQVVGTWDGTDIRIYVNGVETGKTESTKRPSSVSTFYVGFGELAPWFYGAIDEVAYYPVALNANRVYQHWLADPPPPEEGVTSPPDGGTDPASPGDEPTGEPGGTDPGEPGEPTIDPEGPTGDPDTPVGSDPDDPTVDPDPGDPAVDTPTTDPGDGSAESGGPKVYKGNQAKAKRRKAKIKKCQKIKNPAKRKACLKRARRY